MGGAARPEALAAPDAPPHRFERTVDVAAPGWTRVALDAAAWFGSQADHRDLQLWDPAGGEVTWWLVPDPSAAPARVVAGRVTEVTRIEGGWLVGVDLGENAPAHQSLRLGLSRGEVLPDVTLESSADGDTWREVAVADLFRLGEDDAVQGTTLRYPATTDRYLRLRWSASADAPALDEVIAEAAPATGASFLDVPLEFAEEAAASGAADYRLVLPGAGRLPSALALTWDGAALAAVRLLLPGDGRWMAVVEGSLTPGTSLVEVTGAIDGGWWADPVGGVGTIPRPSHLRLELRSGAGGRPILTSVSAREPRHWMVFRADTAGEHLLTYGAPGVAPAVPPPGGLPIDLDDAAIVPLGPEAETALPALPPALLGPGTTLDADEFGASWRVEVDGEPEPGQLVRLVLPDEVYGAARDDAADVRLASGGRRLPHVLWQLPEPTAVTTVVGVAPWPLPDDGGSFLRVEVSRHEGLPISSIELSTDAVPFRRDVSAEWTDGPVEEPRRGAEGGLSPDRLRPPFAHDTWVCPGISPRPCRLEVPVGDGATRYLLLVFGDRENAPLKSVDVRVWRRGHEVVFPWPGDDVVLLAGNADLGPPAYDLEEVADQLVAYPFLAGRLQAGASEDATVGRWFRSLSDRALAAAIAVAAVVLLVVLARVVRTPVQEGSG